MFSKPPSSHSQMKSEARDRNTRLRSLLLLGTLAASLLAVVYSLPTASAVNKSCDGSGTTNKWSIAANGRDAAQQYARDAAGFPSEIWKGFGSQPWNDFTSLPSNTNSDSRLSSFDRSITPSAAPMMTFMVTNTNDSGAGSLRQAIEDAINNPGLDTIAFNIPGSGVHTIAPTSIFPQINDPVIIDGYTQPGATPNTLANGDNAVLLIELNGSSAGGGVGLTLNGGAGGSTIRGLVINRFTGGITLSNLSDCVFEGNFIGTDPTGRIALGNGLVGIALGGDIGSPASNILIGGATPSARNVISGNGARGISANSFVSSNVIQGNFIGVDATGANALGNVSDGIFLSNHSNGNLIGGTNAAARNVISGNGNSAVLVFGCANNVIQGNFIGTDVTGTLPLGNADDGVILENGFGGNIVGGTVAGAGNVISANTNAGVVIASNGAPETNDAVQGNFIGTDVTGTNALGNTGVGVVITDASSASIGGTAAGAGNIIAHNGGIGVDDLAGKNNSILGNSIFLNGGLGIDLVGDGVTQNDPCDPDPGPNNLQNFPVITSALNSGGSTTIMGTLNSTASTTFRIEFFSNPLCDPLGNGEGKTFLGTTNVTTDGSCNASFNVTLPVVVSGEQVVTATATDPNGNTSEFSACRTATTTPPTLQYSASNYNVTEDCTFVDLTVTRTGDTSGASTVDFATSDGGALQRTDYTIGSGTVSFAATETSKTFPILITEDHYVEGAEQLSVTLSNPTGATLGNPNVATVTINDDDTVQTPSPATKIFGGTLNGGQETPANNSTGRGLALVELSADETTANVSVSFSGLGSAETAAHIHGPGARGVSAPILFPLPNGNFNSFQVNLTSSQVSDLKAGLLYVNVHSNNFANGEIRAQLEFNPIDDPTLFVGQHYHDFLARQADASGQSFWVSQITQCGNNAACERDKRIDNSNAFFYELEFQQTGAYVYRLYRAAFGNLQPFPNPDSSNTTEANKLPSYLVFARDRARVVGGADLAQGQQNLANVFVQRPEFLAKYPASLDGSSFIDAVLNTIKNDLGVDLTGQKPGLLTLFNSGGRGAVMYRLADDNAQTNPINNRAFIDAEYNRAFVATQYFGYLRRDSDIGGFLFWLGQVSSGPLRDVPKQHAMVCSFITSAEYQLRFSSVVTHSNADCPQ